MLGNVEHLARLLRDAVSRSDELDTQQEDWRRRWASRSDNSRELMAERTTADWIQARWCINREIAHYWLLLQVGMHDQSLDYDAEQRPMFAMNHDEIQDKLGAWIVEVVTQPATFIELDDPQRLLLGWCAQLLVGSDPRAKMAEIYTGEYTDVARSVYAFAISDDVGSVPLGFDGRGRPNPHLILALTSFSFLEGVARRRLSAFMDETGLVHTPFLDYGPKTPKKRCNSVADALEQVQAINAATDLGPRLAALRADIAAAGPSHHTQMIGASHDLFRIIQNHRNSNMHGGENLWHVGLAALLLATIIAFHELRDVYETYRDTALASIRMHAPTDPDARWPHFIYYPVTFPSTSLPLQVNDWELMRHITSRQ